MSVEDRAFAIYHCFSLQGCRGPWAGLGSDKIPDEEAQVWLQRSEDIKYPLAKKCLKLQRTERLDRAFGVRQV